LTGRTGIKTWKIEFIFHAIVCILMMGAFFPMFRGLLGIQTSALEGDPFQRSVLTAAYVLAMLALCFRFQEVLFVIGATPALWLLLLWATLSILWSGFPDIAFRRVLALWLTQLYGLVLYVRFDLKSLLRLLGGTLLAVLTASLVLIVVFPEWAVMGPPLLGKWRGVFIHKNHLGRFSALELLFSVYLFSTADRKAGRVTWALGIVIGLVALFGSQSLSALLVVAGMILSAFFFRALQTRRKRILLVLPLLMLAAAMAILLLAQNYDRIMSDALNKDASLSGRLPLWQGISAEIAERPLLGFGFGTFWLGLEGPAAEICKRLHWDVPHAHNGYLDLWLHLGLPGLILGLFLLLRLFARSASALFTAEPGGWFWLLFSIYVIGYNMVESVLLTANSLFWVLIVYGSFHLAKPLRHPLPVSAESAARP
jgi:O-antigen ligase